MSSTLNFNNVYVVGSGITGANLEKEGPLGKYLDESYEDLYCNKKNYELAEQELLRKAIEHALKNTKLNKKDIDIMFGGDLLNQITTTSYVSREFDIPLIGVFGACSTTTLSLGLAASYVEANYVNTALAFTSSHNATAERQFRYPNEYGIQKKPTTTSTVTGAGAIIVSNTKSDIKVTSATFGEVVDYDFTNVNDLGTAMAPAAHKTIKQHLKDRNIEADYYDLILTGDLSKYGKEVLIQMFRTDNIDLSKNYDDCGLLIYDIDKQPVFAGGSGCACCAITTFGYILDKLRKKELTKVLVVATGALHSATIVQQKESIVSIAHAVSLEVV